MEYDTEVHDLRQKYLNPMLKHFKFTMHESPILVETKYWSTQEHAETKLLQIIYETSDIQRFLPSICTNTWAIFEVNQIHIREKFRLKYDMVKISLVDYKRTIIFSPNIKSAEFIFF